MGYRFELTWEAHRGPTHRGSLHRCSLRFHVNFELRILLKGKYVGLRFRI